MKTILVTLLIFAIAVTSAQYCLIVATDSTCSQKILSTISNLTLDTCNDVSSQTHSPNSALVNKEGEQFKSMFNNS